MKQAYENKYQKQYIQLPLPFSQNLKVKLLFVSRGRCAAQ